MIKCSVLRPTLPLYHNYKLRTYSNIFIFIISIALVIIILSQFIEDMYSLGTIDNIQKYELMSQSLNKLKQQYKYFGYGYEDDKVFQT